MANTNFLSHRQAELYTMSMNEGLAQTIPSLHPHPCPVLPFLCCFYLEVWRRGLAVAAGKEDGCREGEMDGLHWRIKGVYLLLLLCPLHGMRHKMDTPVLWCPDMSECRCSFLLCISLCTHTETHRRACTYTHAYVQFRSIFHLIHEG